MLLALGAPLGEFTLWGKYPGMLPQKLRLVVIIQIIILSIFTLIVASKAGIAFEPLKNISKYGIWVVLVFFTLGSFINLTSPSKKEKIVMGPLNVIA